MDRAVGILEKLSSEQLNKFRHILGETNVPAGRIENADSIKLVELIKQSFPNDRERMGEIMRILKEIPRMDLVEPLEGNDAFDGQDKKAANVIFCKAPTTPEGISCQQRDSVKIKPTASSDERKCEDYGRNTKLRYPSILQIGLGLVIISVATTSVIATPHRLFLPLRIPWWSGVLFCVVGIMPLLPLKKTETYKLKLVLGSNIFGLVLALTSIGLSVWNAIDQKSDCKDYLAKFHWLIVLLIGIQLVFSIWNIAFISWCLNKKN